MFSLVKEDPNAEINALRGADMKTTYGSRSVRKLRQKHRNTRVMFDKQPVESLNILEG